MILRDVTQEKPEEREHHDKDNHRDDSAHHALSPSEVDDPYAALLLEDSQTAAGLLESRTIKALTARAATVSLPSQHALEPVPPA
jgi:hypothetical protein